MLGRWILCCSFLVALFGLVLAESSQCSTFLTIHEIMGLEGGVMTIDDEAGLRQVKVSTFEIGACGTSPTYSSGSQFSKNFTLLGLRSPLGSGFCLTKYISEKLVMESMQAVVVETNGWLLEPQSVHLDDIDSQLNVPLNEAWMESAAAFAVVSGEIVLPKVQFSGSTLLSAKEFLIPKDAMTTMGLRLEEAMVPGAEFSGKELFNCPFADTSPDAERCRMTISFEKPVDTMVFLYALKQSSYTETDAAMFISQVDLNCGCRCVTGSVGNRDVAIPLKEQTGRCSRISTDSPRTECDILGKKWCTMESSFAYKITGEQLEDGNYPCSAEPAFEARVLSDFSPLDTFVPAI